MSKTRINTASLANLTFGDEETAAPENKSHKRKKPSKDGAFTNRSKNPKKQNNFSQTNGLDYIRYNHSKISSNGNEIKSSAMIRTSPLRSLNDENKKTLAEKFNTIPNYTPPRAIVKASKTGTPLIIQSSTSTLYLESKNGIVNSYSTDKENIQPDEAKEYSETTEKNISLKITPALLTKVSQEIKTQGKARNQNQIMGESAYAHAKANELSDDIKYEWLHLVAFQFLGKIAQTDKNLVCGTEYANTNMLTVEAMLRYLSQKMPDGFDLNISAHLIKNTDVATIINYTIITKEFTLPFTFDAQAATKPTITSKEYTKLLFETLCDCGATNTNSNTNTLPQTNDTSSLDQQNHFMFFSKSEQNWHKRRRLSPLNFDDCDSIENNEKSEDSENNENNNNPKNETLTNRKT